MNQQTDLYLDLLKRVLINTIYQDPNVDPARPQVFDLTSREEGRDWPRDAHTMIGRLRLDNLQQCCQAVLRDAVPGDLLEAGVWRGGAGIFMRAILKAHEIRDRCVYLADSFAGLPPPAKEYPQDEGDILHTFDLLRVSEESVRDHFERYGLLDDQVRFLRGWFKDTLPAAPIDQLAILRLDGDMYESTWQALDALYPKLSSGGFVIIDDYNCIPGCNAAVRDFRERHSIGDPLVEIDWTGAYWRKG